MSRLGSAASYMGYENLYQLYREWKEQLDALVDQPDGQDEAADVVEDYIIRANALVSGATTPVSTPVVPVVTQPQKEPATEAVAVKTPVKSEVAESVPDVAFNDKPEIKPTVAPTEPVATETPSVQQVEAAVSKPVETAKPEIKQSSTAKSDSSGEDERFIRLTQALEEGFSSSEQQEYETLHGVFEEMLSNDAPEEPATAKSAPTPSKPVLAKAEPKPQTTAKPKPAVNKPKPTTTAAKSAAVKKTTPKAAAVPAKPKQPAATQSKPKQPAPASSKPKPSAPAQTKPIPKPTATPAAEPAKAIKEESKVAAINKPTAKAIKKSIRVESDRIDTLMNQVGELVVDRSYFTQLLNEVNQLQRHLKDELGVDKNDLKNITIFGNRLGEAINSLTRTSNELQEGVMKVRMLPISQLFSRYPRLIHDLTNNTKKKVKLELKGEDTELDKMIVEELSDPLIHIIRNSVDHGIEPVDERLRMGKPEEGTLQVEAYQEGNQIVIEVQDDGRGIDPEKLKAKAMQKGLHNRDELDRMSHQDLIRLIMQPGFSTAEKISRTSGRGVGMDVVKKNIERLNGTIDISSQKGIRTRIRLRIPLTLAIIQALQVKVAERLFTIPLSNVMETLNIEGMGTSFIEGTEVLHLRGRTLPIFRLNKMFKLENRDENQIPFVVVVSAGTEQVGLVVDELIGQDEVVIKPLAEYVQENSGFSGATIIGDGRISLILDVAGLINLVAQEQTARHQGLVQKRRIEAKGGNDARG